MKDSDGITLRMWPFPQHLSRHRYSHVK